MVANTPKYFATNKSCFACFENVLIDKNQNMVKNEWNKCAKTTKFCVLSNEVQFSQGLTFVGSGNIKCNVIDLKKRVAKLLHSIRLHDCKYIYQTDIT